MLRDVHASKLSYVLIHEVKGREDELKTCFLPKTGTEAGAEVEFPMDIDKYPNVRYVRTFADAAAFLRREGAINCPSTLEVRRAIADWSKCRCDGECDAQAMKYPPQIMQKATRSETLAYCDELKAD